MHPSTCSAVIHIDMTSKHRTIGKSSIHATSAYTNFLPSHHSEAFHQDAHNSHIASSDDDKPQFCVPNHICAADSEKPLGRRRQLSSCPRCSCTAGRLTRAITIALAIRTILMEMTMRKMMTTSTASTWCIADDQAILGACFSLSFSCKMFMLCWVAQCAHKFRISAGSPLSLCGPLGYSGPSGGFCGRWGQTADVRSAMCR